MIPLTHASFFSGVGGMDIGLESAGWHTVSFSEIEPYACAVLSERWPGVPNLGDITRIDRDGDWQRATLWTGGFPCQDLSVAGKRGGIHSSRSGLAWSFLDLVERHRPQSFILENVPGILTSNAGRDFGRLLRKVGELRYGWAYRVLDAQFFGVPQRRKRVFIIALDLDRHPDPDRSAEVLSVGTVCGGHSAASRKARSNTSDGFAAGIGDAETSIVRTSPDPDGVRTSDGLAGRLDDCERVAYVKAKLSQTVEDDETWRADGVAPTLNTFGIGDARAITLITGGERSYHQRDRIYADIAPTLSATTGKSGDAPMIAARAFAYRDDGLLPEWLDGHRYRCCGNGIVSPVAEWIGMRLRRFFEQQEHQV